MENKEYPHLTVGFCYDKDYGIYCEITGIGLYSDPLLTIPDTIHGYKVRSIADGAFENRFVGSTIIIPNGVIYIGKAALDHATICFDGTREQWLAIDKGSDWAGHSYYTITIRCTDGNEIFENMAAVITKPTFTPVS